MDYKELYFLDYNGKNDTENVSDDSKRAATRYYTND